MRPLQGRVNHWGPVSVGGVPARRDLPTAIIVQPFRLRNVRDGELPKTMVVQLFGLGNLMRRGAARAFRV